MELILLQINLTNHVLMYLDRENGQKVQYITHNSVPLSDFGLSLLICPEFQNVGGRHMSKKSSLPRNY